MSEKFSLILLVMLLVTVSAAACTPGSQPEPAAATTGGTGNSEADALSSLEPTDPVATESAGLQQVTFAHADQLTVNYYWLYVPEALGYWEDEGLDVEIVPMSGTQMSFQQMAADNADLAQTAAIFVIQGNLDQGIPARSVTLNNTFAWRLGVLEDSPITDISELKGKSIGVVNLATNAIPFLQTYLRANGLDPDADVNLVAIGFGAPAIEAIRNGDVDAGFYWPGGWAFMENQGLELRYFESPEWSQFPDFAIAALESTVDANPEMIEGFVRGTVKGTVFAEANPECAVRLFWSEYSQPTGADEETLFQWDLNFLQAQMRGYQQAYELLGSDNWAETSASEYGTFQNFLQEQGLIENTLDPATFIVDIPDFFERVNDFDHAAIEAQAENCAFE